MNYARELARPRHVGTKAEASVADEIAAHLESSSYQVEREPFQFSTAVQVAIRLEILAAQLLILLIFWAWGVSDWLSVFIGAALAALLVFAGRLNRAVAAVSVVPSAGQPASAWSALCLRLGVRYRAVNLVATLPDLPDDRARPHLCLMAHYDSKSEALPLIHRVALFAFSGTSALTFVALTLLRIPFPALTSAAALAGLAALVSGVVLLFSFLAGTGNASPGAIDNASGVGLALHLAECLSSHPRMRDPRGPRVRVTCLLTSAEELALMGAMAYVQRPEHLAEMRRQAQAGGLHVLNFDGIGIEGRLFLVGGGRPPRGRSLVGLITQACREVAVPLSRLALPGALLDHMPFAQEGFDAVSLITLGRAAGAVHTPADSADRLHVEGFRQCGEVALRVFELLAGRLPSG